MEFTGLECGWKHVKVGVNSTIEKFVTIWLCPRSGISPTICFGNRSFVGQNSYFGVFDRIEIGSNVMIGAFSYVTSASHIFASRELPMRDQGFEGAPVIVEDDVWVGTHCVLLPGVIVGEGSIVGAGSVVTKSIPSGEIWAGAPARLIGRR